MEETYAETFQGMIIAQQNTSTKNWNLDIAQQPLNNAARIVLFPKSCADSFVYSMSAIP